MTDTVSRPRAGSVAAEVSGRRRNLFDQISQDVGRTGEPEAGLGCRCAAAVWAVLFALVQAGSRIARCWPARRGLPPTD